MALWLLTEQSLSNIGIFFEKHRLLMLKNTRQPFCSMFGGHFKQQNQMQKPWHQIDHEKDMYL